MVGAGISGLTSALRLAQRGYNVTIFEEKPEIGGNLAGLESDGAHYDVYPPHVRGVVRELLESGRKVTFV